jgi:hypothetical protein
MSESHGGLFWLLFEAGATLSQARHLERQLDRLRLCGWGSDDLAGILLHWRNAAVAEAQNQDMDIIRKLQSGGKWRTGVADCPGLFDEELRTGG